MDDLISREAAIEAIKEYCNGCDNYNGARCRACNFDDAMSAVDSVLAVDAVEVVYCKDCVNMGKRLPLPKGYREDCGCCMAHGWIVSPETFCSWGETADEKCRREAAEQDAYEQLCNLGNPEDGSL